MSSNKRRPPSPPPRVPQLSPQADEKAFRRLIWFYTRRKNWEMVQRLTHDLGILFEEQDKKKLTATEVETGAVVGK